MFKKYNNGWLFKVGGVDGESFQVSVRYFEGLKFRLIIDLNTESLITIFRFNHKIFFINMR